MIYFLDQFVNPINMQNLAKYTVKVLEKTPLTADVYHLKLEKPVDFGYQAGQFIQWILNKEDKEIFRSYSLCSTPHAPTLDLCIKIVPGGAASEEVKKLQLGDVITIQGPRGRFVQTDTEKNQFYIATGVGLAPILGIIKDELENQPSADHPKGGKKTKQNIYLLFGVRSEKDVFWKNELEQLSKDFSNFNFDITLSQPDSTDWDGLSGRVTNHLEEHSAEHKFYLCGSANMVKDVRKILLEKKVEPGDIHFEIF